MTVWPVRPQLLRAYAAALIRRGIPHDRKANALIRLLEPHDAMDVQGDLFGLVVGRRRVQDCFADNRWLSRVAQLTVDRVDHPDELWQAGQRVLPDDGAMHTTAGELLLKSFERTAYVRTDSRSAAIRSSRDVNGSGCCEAAAMLCEALTR